jgi:hypothetical protein
LTNSSIFRIMQSMKSISFAILIFSLFVTKTFSVPPVINYAGQVAVDGEEFDGNGLFKFAIVNDSGSTTYWSNDGTSTAGSEPTASVSVSVNGGLYSVLLGNSAIQGMNAIDPSVFQQHADAKLRVWFNDGTNGFQQLTPDRPFASVPYAMASGASTIQDGSITRSKLESSIINDLQASIADGSVSKAKMDPNLVRYFVPEISTNPSAVSIIQGTDTTLSVQAEGKFLSYQWQKNGSNLAGQTNSSLVLSNANASAGDANYSVIISNDWGSVTSPLARVTVATALPTITILGSTTLVHEAATSYTDPGATAEDALGGDLTSSISITSADINVTDVGDQVVTYSVSDAGGNANTATRTVTVQDTTDPVITLNQGTSYTHNINTAWVDPGYDAQDTLDGNLTSSVSITGTVDVATTGAYSLNYSVSDNAGNQASVTRTVNVAPMGPWTFTNAGATGRFGPTQAQINTSYAGTSLEGAVTINATHQGIQEWTVPMAGTYRIEAWGASSGFDSSGLAHVGFGAKVRGDFIFSENEILKILSGQQGSNNLVQSSGGGGGTFVIRPPYNDIGSIFVIAGGAGAPESSYGIVPVGQHGQVSQNGSPSQNGSTQSNGGTEGNGGNVNSGNSGGGGGGFFTSGINASPGGGGGIAFVNGGYGGLGKLNDIHGGFGGGGGSYGHGGGPGGGGGFSGGGGGDNSGNARGGGGGSYNSGTNQDNQAGVNEGHGKVIITYIGN